jgi:hypothetical protein
MTFVVRELRTALQSVASAAAVHTCVQYRDDPTVAALAAAA